MLDCMDREQGVLDSSSSFSATPTLKRRSFAALIAAVMLIAVTLLLALPSPAYASEGTGNGSSSAGTQEIPLLQPDSGTSVSNGSPGTLSSPPASNQLEASKTTSLNKNSEVVPVSGAGASTQNVVIVGDKGSGDDDDDEDDSRIASTENASNTNDNKGNVDADSSDDDPNTKDDEIGSGDSTGADSSITDEIATDPNKDQSANPNGDDMNASDSKDDENKVTDEIATDPKTDSSANPTGDIDKADDVIAAPCDGESADQTVGAASDKAEEVKQGRSEEVLQAANDVITPQANTLTVYLRFQSYDEATYGGSTTVTTYKNADIKNFVGLTTGSATDKIYKGLTPFAYAGNADGYDTSVTTLTYNQKLPTYERYGYKTMTNWTLVYINEARNMIYVKQISTTVPLTTSYLPATGVAGACLFANWVPIDYQVKYYQNGKGGTDISWTHSSGSTHWDTVMPGKAATDTNEEFVEVTSNPSIKDFPEIKDNGNWHMKPDDEDNFESFPFGLTRHEKSTENYTYPLSFYYSYTPGTAYANGKLTFGQILSSYYPQGDNFDPTIKSLTNFAFYPAFNKMESNNWTISFDGNGNTGGSAPADQTVPKTSPTTTLPVVGTLTKTGFTFGGWNTANDGSGVTYPANSSYTPTADIILYALWNAIITYDQNKPSGATGSVGSFPGNGTATYNAAFTISSDTPTLNGFTFNGWRLGNATSGTAYAAGASIPAASITGPLTLYAQWTAWPTISFNKNTTDTTGGSVPATVSIQPNTTYTVPGNTGNLTRTGYSFKGWSESATGSVITSLTMGTTNKTLYAIWTAWPTITYSANASDTTGAVPTATSAAPSSSYTVAGNGTLARKGYTFAGWALVANGSGTIYGPGNTTTYTMGTSNVTFYAKWTEKTGYTVQFYDAYEASGDGTLKSDQTSLNWTSTVTMPTAPTRTGYNFSGWFYSKTNGNGSGTKFSASAPYSAMFTAAGLSDDTPANATIKLYAQWTEKTRVTFTLNANGGTYRGGASYTENNILNGGSYTIPATTTYANPSRPYYNFLGWTENSDGTGSIYQAGATFSNLTANKTLFAKWAGAPVTITYAGGSSDVTTVNSSLTTGTANYGGNVTTPVGNNVFTRTGYTFGGWQYTNTSNGTATVGSATATGTVAVSNLKLTQVSGSSEGGNLQYSVTLTAKWTALGYDIVWNRNDGSGTSSTTTGVNADTSIALPAAPTRNGYEFKGWNTAADGTGTVVTAGNKVNITWVPLPTSTGTSNAQLNAYAQWVEKKVEIRFYSDANTSLNFGGSGLADGNVFYVGQATGDIYNANTDAATKTGKNITSGVSLTFTNSNYEFNTANGSKWTTGSASGATVSNGVASNGTLTVQKASGLFATANYYVTTTLKRVNFTIEYWGQNANDDNYTKISGVSNGTGVAPIGYKIVLGATAGINDTNQTVTFVRTTPTNYTYNDTKTGVSGWAAVSATAANNVYKLYFDRNTYTANIAYAGSVPPGVSIPAGQATQTVRWGATVTLPTVTPVTGYTWGGWSGSGVTVGGSATSFTMPAGNATVTGTWSKQKYNVQFVSSNTSNGTVNGTSTYNLDFEAQLTTVPDITIVNASAYFMGWDLYENCTTAGNYNTGTNRGLKSKDDILNDWKITSTTVFVARFGTTVSVRYEVGAHGAFGTVGGSVQENQTTSGGTYYQRLQPEWDLPLFGVATNGANSSLFDVAGNRNANNPKAAAGWKFTGWKWNDGTSDVVTSGYYDASHRFVVTSGPALPTLVGTNGCTFTAQWTETTQGYILKNKLSNSTVTGAQAQITGTAKTGATFNLPQDATYKESSKPAAYRLLGWTTDANYASGTSPLYTGATFTMTTGTPNNEYQTVFGNTIDGNYGITLYPVFEELTVTINYALANGSATVSLSNSRDAGIGQATGAGSIQGSTPTIPTGYEFKGWFTDAAHTNPVPASWVSGNKIVPQADATSGLIERGDYYVLIQPIQYTITFKVGGAGDVHGKWDDNTTADKTITLAYGTALGSNIPGYTADTGYRFNAWLDNKTPAGTYSQSALASKLVDGNMTYTIQWAERNGFNVIYETNTSESSIASKSVSWNSPIDISDVITKQGYTFAGWFAKNDFSAGSEITAGTLFSEGVTKGGVAVVDGTADLTIYAKWVEKTFTIHFDGQFPAGATGTNPADKTVKWTEAGLLTNGGNSYAVLSAPGFDFSKWTSKTSGSGIVVTDTTTFADVYRSIFGTSDNSQTELTIYGNWGQKTFTISWRDSSGKKLKADQAGMTWNDSLDYFAYGPADGSQRLLSWKYTPAGKSTMTWLASDGKLPVSAFDGTPTPHSGDTFILIAELEPNATYVINYHKVGLNSSGAIDNSTISTIKTESGYVEPNTPIDITNFNGKDYINAFEYQNSSVRRSDLKGYTLQVISGLTKTTALATEVTSGGTVTFEVYFVENLYTIDYDLGSDPKGNTAPSSIGSYASRNVSWTSTSLYPIENLTWPGHKAPKWQYRNASGTLVNIPAGAKVSDIALSENPATHITLYALWDTDEVRLTYGATLGGSAKSTDNTLTVVGPGSKYHDIDSVSGTPKTMVATPNAGYKFIGWFKDGVKLQEDATLTIAKGADGMYESGTYEARFTVLGSINYTIKHFFEELDGSYNENTALSDTRGGTENETINVNDGMKKNVKGFTFTAGITGEKLTITKLVEGEELRLYYKRNTHQVSVEAFGMGADHPDTVPNPVYAATGITQASTTQPFGLLLTLPTMTVTDPGWSFLWTVSYTDSDATNITRVNLNNGDTFTMPDAPVTITGTWTRLAHKVSFSAGTNGVGSGNHGSITTVGAVTTPFSVNHGKTMNDVNSTGSVAANIRVTPDNKWAFAGWSYVDAAGVERTTTNPDTVVIEADTVFTAMWAQTFYVHYEPGTHGGAGFTSTCVAKEEISGEHYVNEYPLKVGGVDVPSNIAPAADGYRFVGWSWTMDGQDHYWIAPTASDYNTALLPGTAATMDFLVDNNVIFHAIWEALEQDLVYKLDNVNPASNWTPYGKPGQAGAGSTYPTKVRTDEVATLLDSNDIQREGYDLVGWAKWVDANGNGTIDDGELGEIVVSTMKMPAHSVTLVPVWDFKSIDIYFDNVNPDRGTLSTNIEKIYDASKDPMDGSVATPNAGYVYAGWFMDVALTTPVDPSWVIDNGDGSFTLRAPRPTDGWIPARYYVSFAPGVGSYTIEHYLQQDDDTYALGYTDRGLTDVQTEDIASVLDPTNPAFTHLLDPKGAGAGYVFNKNAYGQVLTAVVLGDGSTVLKVYYDLLSYRVTFIDDSNGTGTSVELYNTTGIRWNGSVAMNDPMTFTPAYDKVDADNTPWKWLGWEIRSADGAYCEAFKPNDRVDFAYLAAIQGLTKDQDISTSASLMLYGVWAKYVPVTITYYAGSVDPANLVNHPDLTNGSYTYTAQDRVAWLDATYTVTTTDIQKYCPAGYVLPDTNPSIQVEDGANNLVVVYKEMGDFKIILRNNYEGVNEPYQVVDGYSWTGTVDFANLPTPSRTGYNFAGWAIAADGTVLAENLAYNKLAALIYGDTADPLYIQERGLRLFAQWTMRNDFKVDFDVNNQPSIKHVEGDPLTDAPQMIENVAWNQNNLTRDFEDETDYAPLGFKFVGWNTAADGTGLTVTSDTTFDQLYNTPGVVINDAGDTITLYAMWDHIYITIKYVSEDENKGTVSRAQDIVSAATGKWVATGTEDDQYRLTSIATAKPGYHFVRWELVDENTMRVLATFGTNEWGTGTDGAGLFTDPYMWVSDPEDPTARLYNATYRAVFAENDPVSIIYNPTKDCEGEAFDQTIPHGSIITLSNNKDEDGSDHFTRKHYKLIGWNTKEDGSGTSYALGLEDFVAPVGDANGEFHLYAMWEIEKYPVTIPDYDSADGWVVGGSEEVAWGEHLTPEFIDSISTVAVWGKIHTGWRYTMIDADTGETIEGIITDLADLVVLGPVELSPIFEDDPNVGGEYLPQTGDTPKGIWIVILGLGLVLVLFVAWRKSRPDDELEFVEATDDPDDDPKGPKGDPTVTHIEATSRVCGMHGLVVKFAAGCLVATVMAVAFSPHMALATEGSPGGGAQNAPITSKITTATNAIQTDPAKENAGSVSASSSATAASRADLSATGSAAGGAVVTQTSGNAGTAAPAAGTVCSSGSAATYTAPTSGSAPASSARGALTSTSAPSAACAETASTSKNATTSVMSVTASAKTTAQRDETKRLAARVHLAHMTNLAKSSGVTRSSNTDNGDVSYCPAGSTYSGAQAGILLSRQAGSLTNTIDTANASNDLRDLNELNDSTDLPGLTGLTDQADLANSMGPVKSVLAPDPADPSDPSGSTDPANPINPTDPTDPIGPTDPANPTDPGDSPGYSDADPGESGAPPEDPGQTGDSTGGDTEKPDDGADDPPEETDPGSDLDPDPGSGSDSDSDSDSDLDPDLKDKIAISYGARSGGYVSNDGDTISADSGKRFGDTNACKAYGTIAVPITGYHFTGWEVISDNPALDQVLNENKDLLASEKLSSKLIQAYSYNRDSSQYMPVSFMATFAPNTYGLNYDANGGKGSVDATSLTYDNEDAYVASAAPTNDEGEFLGWNTKADGSGITLSAGQQLTAHAMKALIRTTSLADHGDTTTLYATWAVDPNKDHANKLDNSSSTVKPVNPSKPNVTTPTQNATTRPSVGVTLPWTNPVAGFIDGLVDVLGGQESGADEDESALELAALESIEPEIDPWTLFTDKPLEVKPRAEQLVTQEVNASASDGKGAISAGQATKDIGLVIIAIAAALLVAALAGAGASVVAAARAVSSEATLDIASLKDQKR